MSEYVTLVVGSLEVLMALAGLALLWRFVVSPTARTLRREPRIDTWEAPVTEFLLFFLFVIGGFFVAALLAGAVASALPFRGDALKVFNGAFAQLGMLGGALTYWSMHQEGRPQSPPGAPGIWRSGFVTFLIVLPVLFATAQVWETFVRVAGLPSERQDLIRILKETGSPVMIGVMMLLAVVIAPVTEELVFRAGMYRYFRTRMPRWVALLMPALFFASLHVDWKTMQGFVSFAPLASLAIVFSLAYERTGRIGTCMVAHAIFNLNSVLATLAHLDGTGTP